MKLGVWKIKKCRASPSGVGSDTPSFWNRQLICQKRDLPPKTERMHATLDAKVPLVREIARTIGKSKLWWRIAHHSKVPDEIYHLTRSPDRQKLQNNTLGFATYVWSVTLVASVGRWPSPSSGWPRIKKEKFTLPVLNIDLLTFPRKRVLLFGS